ncbi:hypothetical protein APK37_16 [Acinetobacter phage APK37.1]|uniref:Uncharacterized protein n=1 Tax=Acinetobacter phage APK37.1 TaxID=2876569 RepID=A0AAE8XI76_9CAUD|nr:hypothetical protein APK37_16 [Acinetobacter phage APK37.1]
MKFGKVKVGMSVRVALNSKGNSFEYAYRGRVGTVTEKEGAKYNHKIGNYRLNSQFVLNLMMVPQIGVLH